MSLSNNSPLITTSSSFKMPEHLSLLTTVVTTTKTVKRCNHEECKTKLGLTDFDCKCGKRFCSKHRHSEIHNCQYDYRKEAQDHLTKQLVKCDGIKLAERL